MTWGDGEDLNWGGGGGGGRRGWSGHKRPCTSKVTFMLGENCSARFTGGKLRFRETIHFTKGEATNALSLKNPCSF